MLSYAWKCNVPLHLKTHLHNLCVLQVSRMLRHNNTLLHSKASNQDKDQ